MEYSTKLAVGELQWSSAALDLWLGAISHSMKKAMMGKVGL